MNVPQSTRIPRHTAPTLNQVKQLLPSASSDHGDLQVRTVVALVATTGIRPGELAKARWSDVNLDQHSISVSSKGQSRLVPVGPKVLELLQSLRETGTEYVLGYHPERVIVRLSKSLRGFTTRHCGESFNFHELRHSFCLQWLNLGGGIESLCKVAGFSSPSSFHTHFQLSPEMAFTIAAPHQAKIENALFVN